MVDFKILKKNYDNMKLINSKLATSFLSDDICNEFDFLFENIDKKPKLSMLGQSGAGKSTLLNKLIGINLLDSSNGKGAVTQYPIELVYSDKIGFKIIPDNSNNTHELDEIYKDKNYFSETDVDKTEYAKIKDKIYEFINDMNKWDIPFNDKKQTYKWKEFNKKLRGDKNKKYHFEYKNTNNDKEVSLWINVSPFIHKIVFYVTNDLLKHVTLVDLPGLYDKSELRTRKTKEYLLNDTDFIMIVENNNRAITSSFIDKSLNNFVVNIVITKQIPDILMVITQIDNTYKDCIKEECSDEGECSDGEYDIDDDSKESICKDFKGRLQDTLVKLNTDIQNNESLKLHNVSTKNIHISFCSSKKSITDIMKKDTIQEVNKTIQDVCIKRVKRYETSIKGLLSRNYKDIKVYVNKESIQDEERKKIKYILDSIQLDIQGSITVSIQHAELLINADTWDNILIENENYRDRLIQSSQTHGLTLWAVLRKLNHESVNEEIYNVIDDLSTEYIKQWGLMNKRFIDQMNLLYEKNKSIIEGITFSKLEDINGVLIEDINQLKLSIISLLVNGETDKFCWSQGYKSYNKYINIKGIEIINHAINDNVKAYNIKSCALVGPGSSDICRSYVSDMLSVSKSCIVKDNINTKINQLLTTINNDIYETFNSKLQTIFTTFLDSYGNTDIDIEGINTILNTIIII